MTRTTTSATARSNRSDLGRWLLIAFATLILCSCRGLEQQATDFAAPPAMAAAVLEQQDGGTSTEPPQPNPAQSVRASVGDVSVDSDSRSATSDPQVVRTGYSAPVAPAAATATQFVQQAPCCPPATAPTMAYPRPQGYGYPAPGSCYPPQPPCSPPSACPCGVHCGPWTPPGLPCPWPDDEYICDGGDKSPEVKVRQDWSVDGLELEDTVVHYDTVKGDTYVEPSNRVCLYAPRFAAVRKVYGIVQHDHFDRIARVDQPVPVEGLGDVQIATTTIQPVQPGLNLGTSAPSAFRERTPPTGLENAQALTATHGGLLPYQDLNIIRRGVMDNSEKARLAARVQAAMAWSHDTAVQVLIDNIATHEDVSVTGAESVHVYSLMGKPRLQVCKIASRKEARPGETVDFTIRFDNVGDQVIGNVTVIDNLTTRLEYVDGSESCTLKANFSSSENQGDSLTLRWEIVEPMKVGEGGVIRFQCRVR